MQHSLDDGVRLGIFQACQRRHDGHLHLGRRGRSDRLCRHLVPASLHIEELPVLLEAAPERRRLQSDDDPALIELGQRCRKTVA